MADDQQSSVPPEPVPPAPVLPATPPDPGYDPSGVPTFESVREKIENRFGTAIGATELAESTPEGRSVAEQYEKRQEAAAERLRQIRESMDQPEKPRAGGDD